MSKPGDVVDVLARHVRAEVCGSMVSADGQLFKCLSRRADPIHDMNSNVVQRARMHEPEEYRHEYAEPELGDACVECGGHWPCDAHRMAELAELYSQDDE